MVAPAKKAAPAKKVATPRTQARKAAASPVIEPTEILDAPPTRGRRAGTRTATAGAATRTATPRRGRTALAAAPVADPPSETAPPSPEPDQGTGVVEEADLTWRGRKIRIRVPNLEQLTIYRRLSARFAAMADESKAPGAKPMSMEEATRHYDRAIKLITSVVVNREDIDWLEDEMLERRLELADAGDLLRMAFERLGEVNEQAQNRQTRRGRKARLAD